MLRLFIVYSLLFSLHFESTCYAQEHTGNHVLRSSLELGNRSGKLVILERPIRALKSLSRFYEERGFQLAWTGTDAIEKNRARYLSALRSIADDGLNANDYHLAQFDELLVRERESRLSEQDLVALDLLLTDSFLLSASHLLGGKVDPKSIHPEWSAQGRERDIITLLAETLRNSDFSNAFQSLRPEHEAYANLSKAYLKLKQQQQHGGWAAILPGKALKEGDSGPRVMALKRRLNTLNDSVKLESDVFDESLASSVLSFQRRFGLNEDGVVGIQNLEILNVPIEKRIEQVEASLERWRWLPRDLGERHVLVNIARFNLVLVEDKNELMSMKVIIGRTYRRTPVFSDRIRYMVLNPQWHVPRSLAVQDKLALIKKDPAYLQKQNMKLFLGEGALAKEVSPSDVNWESVSAKNFAYRIVQSPGSSNALGKVKFMFPNPYNVYLHDTSNPELFAKDIRSLSSGCVRIEKPLELAEMLLKLDGNLNEARFKELLGSGKEQTLMFKTPVPVHIMYWTAWADRDGSIQFRDDIYQRDNAVSQALKAYE